MAVAEITTLIIDKGTDFETEFTLFNPDNSAASLAGLTTTYAKIRKYPSSPSYESFTANVTTSTGVIKLSLNPTQTSRLASGRNYFDVVLAMNNKLVKVIKGTAIVQESTSV